MARSASLRRALLMILGALALAWLPPLALAGPFPLSQDDPKKKAEAEPTKTDAANEESAEVKARKAHMEAALKPPDLPPAEALAKLETAFAAARNSGDGAKIVEAGEKLREYLQTRYHETLYQLARAEAGLGHDKKVYVLLDEAVGSGFWNVQRLRADKAFARLRTEPRFRDLVRCAWAVGYIWMLEREDRDAFQLPGKVMEALALKPGERVADVGAGSGYFTVPVARAVGETGKVLAVDLMQPMLDHLSKRLKEEHLTNVELIKAEPLDPKLPAGGLDTILVIDTYHYIRERTAYAKRLIEALAPGGRVVVIDYRPKPFEERPWGPPPEQQIAREVMDRDLAAAGLVPVKAHDFLPEQYFVEYRVK